jgi:hypothetical protein
MNLAYASQDAHGPIDLFWKTQWDFFTGGSGAKTGYTTHLHRTGCVLKTSETIEFRRWIRMIIRDDRSNVSFTAVGRVLRCENLIEASLGTELMLYRYTVEFTYPVDAAVLLRPMNTEMLAS